MLIYTYRLESADPILGTGPISQVLEELEKTHYSKQKVFQCDTFTTEKATIITAMIESSSITGVHPRSAVGDPVVLAKREFTIKSIRVTTAPRVAKQQSRTTNNDYDQLQAKFVFEMFSQATRMLNSSLHDINL